MRTEQRNQPSANEGGRQKTRPQEQEADVDGEALQEGLSPPSSSRSFSPRRSPAKRDDSVVTPEVVRRRRTWVLAGGCMGAVIGSTLIVGLSNPVIGLMNALGAIIGASVGVGIDLRNEHGARRQNEGDDAGDGAGDRWEATLVGGAAGSIGIGSLITGHGIWSGAALEGLQISAPGIFGGVMGVVAVIMGIALLQHILKREKESRPGSSTE